MIQRWGDSYIRLISWLFYFLSCIYLFLIFIYFEIERDYKQGNGRERERERETANPKQVCTVRAEFDLGLEPKNL